MDINQCISLFEQYFKVHSFVAAIKKPDLYMKSHVFFYQDIFKQGTTKDW